MSLLDRVFQFNPFAKFFRTARGGEERIDQEQIQNSVGVSQEQIDLYNYINYDYLMSPGSAVTYIGISFEQYFANKHGRIQKYKEMALFPEVSDGLDAVCDEAVVNDDENDIVDLDVIEEMPTHVEEEVRDIWDYLVSTVFAFNERGWDLFRKWLIEAELYIELILNEEGNNIIGIKVLPAHTMMPVYQENKIAGYMQTKIGNPNAQDVRQQQQGSIVFDKDQISYVNYGLYGANMLDVRGYLESAIRTYNQLKNLEDALVVYRLVRAPERRVWNVAIGRMPKGKAEEYLKGLIQRYRKKIIYNADSGEIDSTMNIQSLTEDFWFTRNENGEGTTVETIGGGMQLGELNDINYFLQKLYKTLKLPRSRWEEPTTAMYSSGKSGEILREEIKFSNFVKRLQNRFKYILLDPFITLLRLRGIEERYIDEDYFKVKFTESNLFREYKEFELVEAKMGVLASISTYIYDKNNNPGGLFSKEFALRKFFKMDDDDYIENQKLIKKEEMQTPTAAAPGAELGGGFGGAEMGGGEFGAGPEMAGAGGMEAGMEAGGEAPPAPETGAEAAAAPAESTQYRNKNNGRHGKQTSLFDDWQDADKNIKDRFNKDIDLIK